MRDFDGLVNLEYIEDQYFIYEMASSNELDKHRYIGLTSDLNYRAYTHSKERKRRSRRDNKLYDWIDRCIEEGNKVYFRKLEGPFSKKEAIIREQEIIAELKEKEFILLNITNGGLGCKGLIPWNKGMKMNYSPEHIEKIASRFRGKVGFFNGKKHSEDTKRKLSEKNIERYNNGYIDPQTKKVYKYINGVLDTEYKSLAEASKLTGYQEPSLSCWCRNKQKPKNQPGITWSYIKL